MEPSVLPVNDFEEVQEVTDKKYCSRIAVLLLQQRQKKKKIILNYSYTLETLGYILAKEMQ